MADTAGRIEKASQKGHELADKFGVALEPLARLLGWEGRFSRGFTGSWPPWAFLGLFGFSASRVCGNEPFWGDFRQGSALPLPRGEADGRGKSRADGAVPRQVRQ